jgi:hypothetical protein
MRFVPITLYVTGSQMHNTVSSITTFLERRAWPALHDPSLPDVLSEVIGSEDFKVLLIALVEAPAFSDGFGVQFSEAGAVAAIAPCRLLRGSLNLPLRRFVALLAQLFHALENGGRHLGAAYDWARFAERVEESALFADLKLVDYATKVMPAPAERDYYLAFAARLERDRPQAIYPTSGYRESGGSVVGTADDQTIEAVMHVSTFSTIKIVDRSIDVDQTALRDIYKPIGRCVCLVDENVESLYGEQIEFYFAYHNIPLYKRVYRANEVDKSIGTVEKMLGDFKALGVSRNEPVLIVCWLVLSYYVVLDFGM